MKGSINKIFLGVFCISLFAPVLLFGQNSNSSSRFSGGYVDLSMTSRIFALPLFGDQSPVTYRFLGSQLLANHTNLSVWFNSGYPNSTTYYGLEAAQVPFYGGRLRINAGDFSLVASQPQELLTVGSDSFPLQGAGLRYVSSNLLWNISAGRAKHIQDAGNLASVRPGLFSADVVRRIGRNFLGAGLFGVNDAVSATSAKYENWNATASARVYNRFRRNSFLTGEILLNQNGAIAGKAGYKREFQTGEVNVSLYSFADEFPYLPPIFRPGERGIEFGTRFDMSEFSNIFGTINYYNDDLVQLRSDFRGYFRFGWSPGASRPHIQLAYYRNEINYDPLSIIERQGSINDRFLFSLSKSSFGSFSIFRLEHLLQKNSPSRTQATYDFRRLFDERSFLNGSFLIQREEGAGYGFTAESSLERPWKTGYFYLIGLGVAYKHIDGFDSGQGVARFGLSRRLFANGLRAQIEVAVPFSMGLTRSGLGDPQVLVQLGQRFSWKNLDGMRNAFSGSDELFFGSVEGVIRQQKEGVGGIAVLIDGEQRAITGSNGRFKVSKVRTGPVTLSLDTRRLDPGLSIVGGLSREVLILPDQTSRVDFDVAQLLYFQGAVLVCKQRKPVAARGATVTLQSKNYENTVLTSDVGSFQFDQIPPDVYNVIIDLSGTQLEMNHVPRIGILLNHDVMGYLIKINCDQR